MTSVPWGLAEKERQVFNEALAERGPSINKCYIWRLQLADLLKIYRVLHYSPFHKLYFIIFRKREKERERRRKEGN